MKRLALLGLLVTSFSFAAGDPAPSPAPQNAFLIPKIEQLTRRSMRVIKEDDGVVSVALPDQTSFAKDTQILFFRKKGIRVEVIATGKVLTEERDPKTQKLTLKVDLDKDTVIKYPAVGDFAALLSDPTGAAEADKKEQTDFLVPENDKIIPANLRPGYLDLGLGLMYGSLSTTTTTPANNSKLSSAYRFGLIHIGYFSDYAPFGFEFDSHGGTFPTTTFYQSTVASTERVTVMALSYRFPPIFNRKLEIAPRLTLLSDQFTTENQDENLLTTRTTGLGVGLRMNLNFLKNNWSPMKGEFFLRLQGVSLEGVYYPSLNAEDEGVSRGTNSIGSSGYSLRIAATALAWFEFIPIFKRWVVQGSYGFRNYSLKFGGPTTPESVPSPVVIPEGGGATEREGDLRFFVGIRFDDPVKLILKDKLKK